MCGIVGYIGKRNSTEILLGGLKKLEYRGYDSAGIAVMTSEGLQVRKSQGRLAVLEQKLQSSPLKARSGSGIRVGRRMASHQTKMLIHILTWKSTFPSCITGLLKIIWRLKRA